MRPVPGPQGRRRVQVVTTWFPSRERIAEAPFNLMHAKAIALHDDVSIIHVRLGGTEPETREDYAGFDVVRLSLSPRRPLTSLRTLRIIRKRSARADIVHTMAFSSVLVTAIALAFLPRRWVHTEHWNGVVNPRSVSRLWGWLAPLRRVLSRPDRVTGVTSQLADAMQPFARPGAVSVVPCVVENRRPITQPLWTSPVHLVAVGHLVPRKGPLVAVQTLRRVVDEGVDARMTWVGDGPQRAEVERLVSELGLDGRFSITGFVDPSEVFDQLAAADLFFLPTTQENFFTAAAEALSEGRAVVAARVGGFTDYLDESNSVLVDAPVVDELWPAIVAAVNRFRSTDAEALAAPIRERFSLETVGEQFERIYRELLG